MAYQDAVSENLQNAAEKACEFLDPALITLMDLMADSDQTGPVRIAACKTIMDYALKLDARAMTLNRQEASLDRLKAYLDEFDFPADKEIMARADGGAADEDDVDAYDED